MLLSTLNNTQKKLRKRRDFILMFWGNLLDGDYGIDSGLKGKMIMIYDEVVN